jgi:hypothetical protein
MDCVDWNPIGLFKCPHGGQAGAVDKGLSVPRFSAEVGQIESITN